MKVTIKFNYGLGNLIENYNSEKGIILELNHKEIIKSIIIRHFSKNIVNNVGIVMVNKKLANLDYYVNCGDIIEIFPILGGG